tara:strand:- start:11108 stop:12157 length:1050 start_codon:yes stop_codon:yes gene_type:complete
MQEKSNQFKNYLRKIGSGDQTSKGLTREESSEALKLILTGIPSPAQIGAFMIAHRIRRPEPQELAGMVDTYLELGPKFKSEETQRFPLCLAMPFDGRIRTSPIYPLTTLVLLSAGQPVVLQGGKRMPVKYGITTNELFLALGINLIDLSLEELKACFLENGLAFIYQPDHFPIAEKLIYYREEIGKRPPIASMELIWSAHQSEHLLVSGFVHSPTEERHWKALGLLGEKNFMTIKGLEGSTDLPISRKSTINHMYKGTINKIIVNPKNSGYSGKDISFKNLDTWTQYAMQALNNEGPLKKSLLWNAGFYLWSSGASKSMDEGIKKAIFLIEKGIVKKTIKKLIEWRTNI